MSIANHQSRLHRMAVAWLAVRANPEAEGGLGVFADTRFCTALTELLEKVDEAAFRRGVAVGRAHR